MSKNSENSNNADILVLAMKRVFKEAVEEGVIPLGERMDKLGERVSGIEKNMATKADLSTLREDMERGLKTTDQNVQRQLVEHRKGVAADFKKELGKG